MLNTEYKPGLILLKYYKLIGLIGKGGFGCIWEGINLKNN